MELSWRDLQLFRRHGMSFSALIVLVYLAEHGKVGAEVIAEACGFTDRTVYDALRRIKRLEAELEQAFLP